MDGINKVIIIGSVGVDPEVRYAQNGNAIANISIATNESWKDKVTGEKQTRTEWHRVVFFGGLAEVVKNYVRKGSKLYIEGKLRTRKWTDKNNQDRYTTEIVVDIKGRMEMLGSRNDGSTQGNKTTPPPTRKDKPEKSPANNEFPDDDIPF